MTAPPRHETSFGDLRLGVAEVFLPLFREYLRGAHALPLFYEGVGVVVVHADLKRERFADGVFAAAGHSHEDDVAALALIVAQYAQRVALLFHQRERLLRVGLREISREIGEEEVLEISAAYRYGLLSSERFRW